MQYLLLLRGQAGELMRLKAQKSADEYARVSLWFTKQFDVLRSTFHPSMRLNPPPMQEQVVQLAAGLLTNLRLGGSKTLRYP